MQSCYSWNVREFHFGVGFCLFSGRAQTGAVLTASTACPPENSGAVCATLAATAGLCWGVQHFSHQPSSVGATTVALAREGAGPCDAFPPALSILSYPAVRSPPQPGPWPCQAPPAPLPTHHLCWLFPYILPCLPAILAGLCFIIR